MSSFKKASRKQLKLRMALIGPTGSGKTRTALMIAAGLGKRIAVIDTEERSASYFVGAKGVPEFEVCELDHFEPRSYVQKIREAESEGFDVIIVDSLTHAWSGKGGALEMVDNAARKPSNGGNNFAAWREVTPEHNALVEALVRCKAHLIVTMRAKMAYDVVENERGKKVPVKIGLSPIQRDGMEYEFSVICDLDTDHNLFVSKSRLDAIDQRMIRMPDAEFGREILAILNEGKPVADPHLRPPRGTCPKIGGSGQHANETWLEAPGGWVQWAYDNHAARIPADHMPWVLHALALRRARKIKEREAEEAARVASGDAATPSNHNEEAAREAAEAEAAERHFAAQEEGQ